MSFLPSSLDLPRVEEPSEVRDLRETVASEMATVPEATAAQAALQESRDNTAKNAAGGIFTSNPITKLYESGKDTFNRYANTYKFLKGAYNKAKAEDEASTKPTVSASQAKQMLDKENQSDDQSHFVTLFDGIETFKFFVMPEIVEDRSVEYEAVAPAQFPGAFQKYKGTSSVSWSVNATLICRTSAEATQNLADLNLLRSWTMPFFGENTRKNFPNKLGAPPPVLIFKGLREGIIGPVPVVMTSLNWNWPRDVDYIPAKAVSGTAENIPFPTVLQISIRLVESFSTKQFNQFSLANYRAGDMLGAYGKEIGDATVTAPAIEEPAQKLPDTGAGGGRGFYNPALVTPSKGLPDTGAGGGRGFYNPEVVDPKRNSLKTVTKASVPIPKFVSGGGGDFGGGGASGDY